MKTNILKIMTVGLFALSIHQSVNADENVSSLYGVNDALVFGAGVTSTVYGAEHVVDSLTADGIRGLKRASELEIDDRKLLVGRTVTIRTIQDGKTTDQVFKIRTLDETRAFDNARRAALKNKNVSIVLKAAKGKMAAGLIMIVAGLSVGPHLAEDGFDRADLQLQNPEISQ